MTFMTVLRGGMPFADAMERHKGLFPKLVTQLTRAGEVSGNLEVVLEQAAEQMERKRELIVTVMSAMMYPAFATFVAVGVTAYLMIKIVPDIARFVIGEGRKLPAMTSALIATSQFVNTYLLQISITVVSVVVGTMLARKWEPAARVIDRILLRVPIIGKLLRFSGTAMFGRGMAMLLDAGVPMLTALDTAGGLMKNRAFTHRVDRARLSVLAGNSLAKPLARAANSCRCCRAWLRWARRPGRSAAC